MRVKGIVISGSKKGSKFVDLPWVREQIITKLNFDPYIGTLNLKISNKNLLKSLHNSKGIIIKPESGYYEGKCFKAIFMDKIECAVVIPVMPNYPNDLLEIIASENLRKFFDLKDGMIVDLEIMLE